MTRHIFRLVWNRKRATGLILLEILICFLVLCGILTAGVRMAHLWSQPLGFEYENVWKVSIDGISFRAEGEQLAADRRNLQELLRAVQALPDVESAAISNNIPYDGSTWMNGTWVDGRSQSYLWTLCTPELAEVLRLRLLHGRWIQRDDAALGYRAVVLNRSFARALFGDEDPIGREVPTFDDEGRPTEPEEDAEIHRVVGIMEDFRRWGELRELPHAMILPLDLEAGESMPQRLVVRVRPGTSAAFEETLVRTLQSIGPQWSYDTSILERDRRTMLIGYATPLLLAAVVSTFLILMVGLGLVGVLWLSVTRRTSELGLRRALGASSGSVRRQILGELWALTTLAVGVGSVIFLQLPLFGANFGVGWLVFLAGSILAAVVLYAFVTVCGLYPTWLATRIQPATALQYE